MRHNEITQTLERGKIITMETAFLSRQLRLCSRAPPASASVQEDLCCKNWRKKQHRSWVDAGIALPTVPSALMMINYSWTCSMLGMNLRFKAPWNNKKRLDSKCKRVTVRRYAQIIASGTFSAEVWKGTRWTTAKVTGRAHGHFPTLCYVCLITVLSQTWSCFLFFLIKKSSRIAPVSLWMLKICLLKTIRQ